MDGQLVGRRVALAAIERALERVSSGRPAALGVTGEPGIGKSRVLAELASRAQARGLPVLEGRAAEFESDLPFALFVDAIDDALASLDRRRPTVLGMSAREQLGTIFPWLMDGRSGVTIEPERHRVYRATRSLLGTVLAPVVLVLDDVHWADAASVELLGYLLSRPVPGGVVIALGYRAGQLPRRLEAVIERGAAGGRVDAVELAPLSRSDAWRLIGADVPSNRLDDVYAETGGNPFYLLELARAAPAHPSGAGVRGDGVPQAVLAAIRGEIAALPGPVRALAQGAAVAGEPFDVEPAAAAAAIAEPDALALVDRLLAAGLVRGTDVPHRFAFRHPLVRRAVYESIAAGWRIAAHGRLAALLCERGAAAGEVARHVEASARPGDREAIALLSADGRAIAGRAPAIAARRFAAALRLLGHGEPVVGQRLELLVAYAGVLGTAGRLDECRAALLEALALVPEDATTQRVRIEASCAGVEHLIGLGADAHRRLCRALDAVGDPHSGEAAMLTIELACDAQWRSDWDALLDWATRGRALARTVGDRRGEALAGTLLALGEHYVAAVQRALPALDAAAELADALGDDEFEGGLDAFFYLAYVEGFLERYEAAVRHAERGLALARATGHGQFLLGTLTAKAWALRPLGRLGEAIECADDAVEGARLAGQRHMLGWALGTQCGMATACGALELAIGAGEECLDTGRRHGLTLVVGAAGWQLGEALLEAGEPARAIAVVQEAVGGDDAPVLSIGHRCVAWHVLARAEVARARHGRALAWIERIDAVLPGFGTLGYPRFLAESARAELLLACGDPTAAAEAALRAARATERSGARLDAARARLLAGRALAETDQHHRAVALLEQAAAELERCGAIRWRDQALRELRRLGHRAARGGRRAGARDRTAELSERERQIAELAAAGRTNREIAGGLFLSTRTVERHLTHIYRKLDIASRAQIGTALVRPGGLADPPDVDVGAA